jgi:hypothetical protein
MFKNKVEYVEVSKPVFIELKDPRRPEAMSHEMKEMLKTLQLNPAFQYLLNRFQVAKAAARAKLDTDFSLTEQQMHFLQAGIYWAGFIENDLAHLTAEPRRVEHKASQEDLEMFRDIEASIEMVG